MKKINPVRISRFPSAPDLGTTRIEPLFGVNPYMCNYDESKPPTECNFYVFLLNSF